MAKPKSDPPDLTLDVAVVGGGVAGCYTAWRLRAEQQGPRVGLFEHSDRIGGRLYSKHLDGMPHVVAELGGMRFRPKQDVAVESLVHHLRLPTRFFPMGDPAAAVPPFGDYGNYDPKRDGPERDGDGRNLVYFRRTHQRVAELKANEPPPFKLAELEQGLSPEALLTQVQKTYLPLSGKVPLADLPRFATQQVLGRALYEHGYWNLLYQTLSPEGYEYTWKMSGYDETSSNANAASALQSRPAREGYRTLVDGYQALPRAMEEAFQNEDGLTFLNHRLVRFDRLDDGKGYLLQFARTCTDELGHTTDDDDAPPYLVHARRIVLAMPRRALELIDQGGFFFQHPVVRHGVRSVAKQAAFKLFFAYPHPWWRGVGLYGGRSRTDMPLRQVYYFLTEGEQPGADPSNLRSLLMASYSGADNVAFWKGLEGGTLLDPDDDAPSPSPHAAHRLGPAGSAVTDAMSAAAQQQLRELHGLQTLPEPVSGWFQDWTVDPYGAAWHAWKPGYRFWELIPRMRNPIPDEQVYICGSCYSNNQGWVEGALETAELMLREHFDLRPAPWLPTSWDPEPWTRS